MHIAVRGEPTPLPLKPLVPAEPPPPLVADKGLVRDSTLSALCAAGKLGLSSHTAPLEVLARKVAKP